MDLVVAGRAWGHLPPCLVGRQQAGCDPPPAATAHCSAPCLPLRFASRGRPESTAMVVADGSGDGDAVRSLPPAVRPPQDKSSVCAASTDAPRQQRSKSAWCRAVLRRETAPNSLQRREQTSRSWSRLRSISRVGTPCRMPNPRAQNARGGIPRMPPPRCFPAPPKIGRLDSRCMAGRRHCQTFLARTGCIE